MKSLIRRFVREEEGQDIIEYAMLAAFISVIAWTVLNTIGGDVANIYQDVQDATGDAAEAP